MKLKKNVPEQMKGYCSYIVLIIIIFFLAPQFWSPAFWASSNAAKPVVPVGTAKDDIGGIFCGPDHGKCPDDLCCSLHNECGKSIAHCNLSLGCKKKWGVCD